MMRVKMQVLRVFYVSLALLSHALFAEPDNNNPPGYAVASAHPLATQAGLDILEQGGNAFDAAIAVAAVLGVAAPYHSGLGGGGFWLLHEGKSKKNIFIDARETAPLAAKKDMFLDKEGQIIKGLSLNGGLAAAIPGQPAAIAYIASHHGRFPLSRSLASAIRLAEEGFIVDHQFWSFSTMGDRLEQLGSRSAAAKIFLKQGKPYQPGERLIQTDLAKTLKLLAAKGQQGFYQGEIAEKLVKGVNREGGIWSLKDLENYRVKIREPLQGTYKNMLIVTAPPPSAGGVSLLLMLNVLANYPLSSFSRVQWVHHLVESMRLAYWQRLQYVGDPDFVNVPLRRLLSVENAQWLTTFIQPDKATASRSLPSVIEGKIKPGNTTHISVIDAQGNRVAATLTVNYIFGSSVVADGTGVLLNDEMDDFSSKPGVKNVFGIPGSEANSIAPGKRPVSSMTPAFLEVPGRVAIFGTPGGSRIPTMMLFGSLLFQEAYGAISMVSAMRFHHQYLPDQIQFEPDTFPVPLQNELKAMGYQLMALGQYYGDMQAISWDKESKLLTATSDPRHIGLAVAVAGSSKGYGLHY